MAEIKVLTNPDLLKLILNFLEKKILKKCAMCKKVIQYQIFNQKIISINIQQYINLETCEKKYFCSEDCLTIYLERYNNISIKVYVICTNDLNLNNYYKIYK